MKSFYIYITIFFCLVVQAEDRLQIHLNSPIDRQKPSSDCVDEICTSLLSMIKNSKSSIDFSIYGLRGQLSILVALKDAEKRGVTVRGVIDKDVNGNSYYSDTYLLEENLKNIRSDFSSDLRRKKYLEGEDGDYKDSKECKRPIFTDGPLQCFEDKGYASKKEIHFSGDIMHNKFFIVDHQFVWTGSTNISDTGIGGYNANLAAEIDSKAIASIYTEEFNQMYEFDLYHKEKFKLQKDQIKTKINQSTISLFFSPQNYAMDEGVIRLIDEAEESINVTIFFLTHNELSKALVEAKKRGVFVRVILDATAATNGYSKHNYLRENGIPLKVESWGGKMHMKAATVDQKHIIMGSMNWTAAGGSKNDENTLIVRNDYKNVKLMNNFFDKLWHSIPEKFLTEDPLPESLDSEGSCFDGIDNDFDKKVDKDDFYGCFSF